MVNTPPNIAAEHAKIELEAHDLGPILPVEVDVVSNQLSNQKQAELEMCTAGIGPMLDTNTTLVPAIIKSPNCRSCNFQE